MVAKITFLVVSTHVQSTENYTKETIQFYDTAKNSIKFHEYYLLFLFLLLNDIYYNHQ